MKRRFLFLLMAVCSFIGANAAINRANNYLEAGDATGVAGKTVVVDILMTNAKSIAIWKTNLVLPEGITLVSAEAAENWTDAVTVNGNEVFSETQTPVAAKSKAVVAKVTLQIDATVAEGEYEIALAGTFMQTDGGETITQVDNKVAKLTVTADAGKEGDLNGDGQVNAADIQKLLNVIAEEGSADINGDGQTNAADIQALLNIIATQA
jgi:hypothetical protein